MAPLTRMAKCIVGLLHFEKGIAVFSIVVRVQFLCPLAIGLSYVLGGCSRQNSQDSVKIFCHDLDPLNAGGGASRMENPSGSVRRPKIKSFSKINLP
jgi:hypothetical protein